MAPSPTNHDSLGSTCWSLEAFKSLLGINGRCLGRLDNDAACNSKLAQSCIVRIDMLAESFLGMAFPSDFANACLWAIAAHSICFRKDHNFLLEFEDHATRTQHSRLHYKWNRLLLKDQQRQGWEPGTSTIEASHREIKARPLDDDRRGPSSKRPAMLRRAMTFTSSSLTGKASIFSRRKQPKDNVVGPKHLPPTTSAAADPPPGRAGDVLPQKDAHQEKVPEVHGRQASSHEKHPRSRGRPSQGFATPPRQVAHAFKSHENYITEDVDDSDSVVSASSGLFTPSPSVKGTPDSDYDNSNWLAESSQAAGGYAEGDQPGQRDGSPMRQPRLRKAGLRAGGAGSELDTTTEKSTIFVYVDEGEISRHRLEELKIQTGVTFKRVEPPLERDKGTTVQGKPNFNTMGKNDKDRENLRHLLSKLWGYVSDSDKQRKPGYVYGFRQPGAPGFIKIGKAEDAMPRIAKWADDCGYDARPVFVAYMPCTVAVIESLVHLTLSHRQRSYSCRKCISKSKGREPQAMKHIEWYETDAVTALKTVALWQRFSETAPYEDGWLNGVWRRNVQILTGELSNLAAGEHKPQLWMDRMYGILERITSGEEKETVSELMELVLRVRNDGDTPVLHVMRRHEEGEKLLSSAAI